MSIIRAEITGSSTATAFGITSTGNAPVLALCRRLIEAGHDPATPLHAYRGSTLCLTVRSIGEGAKLTVKENTNNGCPRFVPYRPPAAGRVEGMSGPTPPIEQNGGRAP